MNMYEKVYYYLAENPKATNGEITSALDISDVIVRNYISRLKKRGLIDVSYSDEGREVTVLDELPAMKKEIHLTYKQEVYMDMIEVFREDFRTVETFEERLRIAREINAMLRDFK